MVLTDRPMPPGLNIRGYSPPWWIAAWHSLLAAIWHLACPGSIPAACTAPPCCQGRDFAWSQHFFHLEGQLQQPGEHGDAHRCDILETGNDFFRFKQCRKQAKAA
jgi:hypothetical protein